MRAATTSAVVAVAMVLSTGCSHSPKQPPVQAQAPPLVTAGGTSSPSDIEAQKKKADTPPPSPLPQPSAQTAPPPLPPPPVEKVKRKRKTPAKPVDSGTSQTPVQTATASQAGAGNAAPASTEQAQAALPGTSSPIGQLTTGDTATGGQTKHETADLINQTQQGLAGIKRTLSNEEQVTATQIRTFLKQAKLALDGGDADGAHTLATKAKLLLDELLKQ